MAEQAYYEDEIDLRDYIEVIIKRKKVILTVFLICVFTATLVSFLLPKIYECSAIIRIGEIQGLLMKKEEAKGIILTPDFLKPIISKLNLNIKLDKLKEKIRVEDIKNTNFLEIKVQYPDAKMAKKINTAIVNSFISQGQALYKERAVIINERLRELEEEIKSTEEAIRKVQNLIMKLSQSNLPQEERGLEIILLETTLSNYERRLTSLREQKNKLQFLLAESKDFKIIKSPTLPQYPIRPKKKLNIAIASVLGLMLGIFIAFFQEFWEKGNNKT